VAIEGRAVLFLGSDGAGKSTAAAEMCLRHGAQMLADDAASLEVGPTGVFVVPSEEEHWLTPDSCRALDVPLHQGAANIHKLDLLAANAGREPCRLGLVVALRFEPSITTPLLRPLRGTDAGRLLLQAVIRFDVDDGVARGREFEQLAIVYKSASSLELLRPVRDPGGVAAFVIDALKPGKA
jgi:hypothetical protein